MAGFLRTIKATSALNGPLHELTGDCNKIHSELRRYAIALLADNAAHNSEFLKGMGRMFANVIVSLYTERDCNEIPCDQWSKVKELYINFASVMQDLGLKPRLIWPSHDAANAPTWAETRD